VDSGSERRSLRANTRLKLTLSAVAICAAVIAGIGYALDQRERQATPPPRGNFDVARAARFDEFTLYFLGQSFEGLPLTAVLRRRERPVRGEPVRANFVSFLYGDCQPVDENDCALPLEAAQNWPLCERSPALYTEAGRPLVGKRLTVRGVPARIFEDGTRLELYTGRTTVVLFGRPDQIRRAAAKLRPANARGKPGDRLPPPAPGGIEGKLPCK